MPVPFFLNTKSEFLKLRRTSAIWLTLFAAAFIPTIDCIICVERAHDMIPKFKTDSWLVFFHFTWKNTAAVILPFYAILLINQILQIEYRNYTWKQVYTTPRKYADIFFSKIIVIHTLIICFLLLFNFFTFISACTANLIRPGYNFFATRVPWDKIIPLTLRVYIGILGVTAIQYWLSARFRNFIIALGFGFGLWATGLALFDWDKIIYYPYMYATLLFFNDSNQNPGEFVKLIVCSIISFPVALLLGFWNIYFS
jgi:hypothetical protein